MKAVQRLSASVEGGNSNRVFEAGEEIPDEYLGSIRNQALVDEPLPEREDDSNTGEIDPFPEFSGLKKVDDVLAWAGSAEDAEERLGRATYALDAEVAGRGRKTLVGALTEMVASLQMAAEE